MKGKGRKDSAIDQVRYLADTKTYSFFFTGITAITATTAMAGGAIPTAVATE